jgi:hypothetical protein
VVDIRRDFGEPGALLGFEYLCSELKRKEPQLKKEFLKLQKDLNTSTTK